MLNRSSTPVMNEISKLGLQTPFIKEEFQNKVSAGSDKKNPQHSHQHNYDLQSHDLQSHELQNHEHQNTERYVKPPQRSNQQTQHTELKNSLINGQVNLRVVVEKGRFI